MMFTYPQRFKVQCQVTGAYLNDGNFTILYNDGGSGIPISDETCQKNGLWCRTLLNNRIVVTDSSDYVRGKVASFRWTGNATNGNLFRADINDGDHCFTCKATHDGVTREFAAGCVKGKRSRISNFTLSYTVHQ